MRYASPDSRGGRRVHARSLRQQRLEDEAIAAELNLKYRIPPQGSCDPVQARVRQQAVAERASWLRHVRARRGF